MDLIRKACQAKNRRILLRIYIEGGMRALPMERAILSAREWIDTRIAKGETWLTEDPFVFKRNVGAYIRAQSSHHRLTWLALQITMDGLYQALWEQGRFNQVGFEIYEYTMSNLVGTGRLSIEEAGVC